MNPISCNKVNIENLKLFFPTFTVLTSKFKILDSKTIPIFFKNSSFKDFLLKVETLICSYEEIDTIGFKNLAKKIKYIFPFREPSDAIEFYQFKDAIASEFNLTSKRKAAKDIYEELKQIGEIGIFNPASVFEVILSNYNIPFDPSVQNYNINDVAFCMQIILNSILIEFDLLKDIEKYIKSFEEINIKAKIKNRKKIFLHKVNAKNAYLIPPQILQDPFFKILQANNVINTHCYNSGNNYISWANDKKIVNYAEDKLQLNRLMVKNTNPEVKLALESIEALIDIQDFCQKEKIKRSSAQFLNNYLLIAPLVKQNYDDNFLDEVAPALLELSLYLEKHDLVELIDYSFLSQDESIFFQFYKSFEDIKNSQEQFFYYIYNELEKLTNKNPELSIYLRDLTNKKGNLIRKYYDPNGLKFPENVNTIVKAKKTSKPKKIKDKNTEQTVKVNVNQFNPPIKITIPKIQKIEKTAFENEVDKILLRAPLIAIPQKVEPIEPKFPGEKFPYEFDGRVDRWDKLPIGEPIPFSGYSHLSIGKQKLQHIFHAPPFAGRFINLGLIHQWHSHTGDNIDRCISIFARISCNKKTYDGTIDFTINTKQKKCYHRAFALISKSELQELFDEKLTLFNQNSKNSSKKITNFTSGNSILSVDNLGNVEINVPDRDLKMQLFNAHSIKA